MDLLENCVVRLLQTSDDTDSGSSLALRIITLIIVVLMIVGNGFFGRRSGKISNEFHLQVTPPGPFFAIWGIIYLLLTAVAIDNIVSNTLSNTMNALLIVTSILNVSWVFIFDYGTKRTNEVCLLILVLMFAINEWMWYDMDKMQVHKVLNRNAIAFYEGWLTAAMNLNLGIVLVHSLGVHKRNQLYIFWACTVPLIIALETAHIVVGGGLDSLGFVVSCIYACIGAAISSYRSVTSNGNTDISLDLKKNSDQLSKSS